MKDPQIFDIWRYLQVYISRVSSSGILHIQPELHSSLILKTELDLPPSSRQTMIVTTEYSELLYMEAENIRRIYEAHKDRMERLLHSNTSISPEPEENTDAADKDTVAQDSELAMAGVTLYQLIKDHFRELIR